MQYIRPEPFGDDFSIEGLLHTWDGCPMMLAILLADGNGRGGGDLNSESEMVGSWAGDKIGVITATDIVPEFSLPGKESEPLLPQIIQVGRDISQDILEVVAKAEGTNFVAAGFQTDCAIPLSIQKRSFFSDEAEQLKTNVGRNPELLWKLCGAEFRFTQSSSERALKTGIEKMYKLIHQKDVVVTIEKLTYAFAQDTWTPNPHRPAVATKSLSRASLKLVIDDQDKKRKVSIKVERDFDIQAVFTELFEVPLFKPKLLKEEAEAQKAKAFVQQLIAGAA